MRIYHKKTRVWAIARAKLYGINNPSDQELKQIMERTIDTTIPSAKISKDCVKKRGRQAFNNERLH